MVPLIPKGIFSDHNSSPTGPGLFPHRALYFQLPVMRINLQVLADRWDNFALFDPVSFWTRDLSPRGSILHSKPFSLRAYLQPDTVKLLHTRQLHTTCYIPDSAAAKPAQQQKVVMTLHSLMKECSNILTKAHCPFSLTVFVSILSHSMLLHSKPFSLPDTFRKPRAL